MIMSHFPTLVKIFNRHPILGKKDGEIVAHLTKINSLELTLKLYYGVHFLVNKKN